MGILSKMRKRSLIQGPRIPKSTDPDFGMIPRGSFPGLNTEFEVPEEEHTMSASQDNAKDPEIGEWPFDLDEHDQMLLSSNVTNIDSMDRELFEGLSKQNKSVEELRKAHPEKVFSDLLEDGFAALYKHAPRLLENVNPARELSKQLIQQMMSLKEYEELRKYTRGDEVFSVGALDSVKQLFEKLPQELHRQQQAVERQQKHIDDLLKEPDFDPTKEKDRKELENRLKQLKEASQDLQQKWEKSADTVRVQSRIILKQAEIDAEKTEAVSKALGWGNEAGTKSYVDMKTRIEAAQKLRSMAEIKKLAKLAGKFINIAAKKQAEKVIYDRQIIEGIEDGNNLIDVVPEEWHKYFNPDLKPLFLKQYAEEKLRQYRLTAKEPQGKGPIACYIDCSGSMGGNPILWASAVALALFFIARKQKRWFMCSTFNTRIMSSIAWPKNKVPTIAEVQQVFGLAAGGGTAYDPPLKHFIDFHKNPPNKFKTP
jgi:uncharacterized protein with von Willebrand factor type A (vWA) domain